jgi:cellulose biosynthesis protein BcsQ
MTLHHASRLQNPTADTGPINSRVICFTSAKGGSGKTILAASTAWLLMQAKCKVIILDTDFSTRGLSLFLLHELTYSNPNVMPDNCLADALLAEIPPERIRPLVIEQKRGTFKIILPNSNFRLGGAPENALLGLGGGPDNFEVRYFNLLKKLCEDLRKDYDYIIIDTRGGYDYSSKIPAILADGYVIVIEADPISVQQVNGLKTNVDAFAKTVNITPNHRGFIINKALYDPLKGEQLSIGLTSFYGGKVFGVIPADRNVISAYQDSDIPFERDLGSDFSYYASTALNEFIGSISRVEPGVHSRIQRLRRAIARAWRFSMIFVFAVRWYPFVFIALLALNLIVLSIYLIIAATPSGERMVFASYILLISAACLMPIVQALGARRESGIRKRTWWISASFSAIFFSLFLLTVPGIHRVLSTYQLATHEPKTMEGYSQALESLGNIQIGAGRVAEAEKAFSEALAIRRELAARYPYNYEPYVASTLNSLGNLYAETGRPADAQKAYAEALSIYQSLASTNPTMYAGRIDEITKSLAKLGGTVK